MREYTEPCDIANLIRMERTINTGGSYLLIEGDSDRLVFEGLIDREVCSIIVTYSEDGNRQMAIDTIYELEKTNTMGVLAIVDSDFCVLNNDFPQSANIILTDAHDLETMIVNSPALEKLLSAYGSTQKVHQFEKDTEHSVRENLLAASLPIGYLRWYNDTEGLSLRFKELKFGDFVDKNTLRIDIKKMIRSVKNHSRKHDLDEALVSTELQKLMASNKDPLHVCCGHDIMKIFGIGLRSKLGSCSATQVEELEKIAWLSYDSSYFRQTVLYLEIGKWEYSNAPYKILDRRVVASSPVLQEAM